MYKTWLLLLAVFCGGAAVRAAEPVPPPPRKPGIHSRNNGMKRFYWRAFSRMTPEERKAMMELQAKDPAEFQKKMQVIAEKLRAANEARRKQIDHLAERCRTGSDEEKAAARKELTEIFREGYQKRLADSRRHLQEMETRMKHLAETLKKKEANADAEIDLLVENCIRGIRPQRPGQAPGRPVK